MPPPQALRERRNALTSDSLTLPSTTTSNLSGLNRTQSRSDLALDNQSYTFSESHNAPIHNLHSSRNHPTSNNASRPLSATLSLTLNEYLTPEVGLKPIPMGTKMQCKIIRWKKTPTVPYTRYELFLDGGTGSTLPILSARREGKTSGSQYLISTTPCGSDDFHDNIVAKVRYFVYLLMDRTKRKRSNFLGTLFSICGGVKGSRQEQGAILYETNILGLKGPRKLTVLLPGVHEGEICPFPYRKGISYLHQVYKENPQSVVSLKNKAPQWNEDSQSYVLNFQNRVSHASVKNFQVVHECDRTCSFSYTLMHFFVVDYIVMQCGRIGEDSFTMDFQYPLSAVQAFGITLSSFEPKIVCE